MEGLEMKGRVKEKEKEGGEGNKNKHYKKEKKARMKSKIFAFVRQMNAFIKIASRMRILRTILMTHSVSTFVLYVNLML